VCVRWLTCVCGGVGVHVVVVLRGVRLLTAGVAVVDACVCWWCSAEMVVAIQALRHNELRVVQASMLGSVLSNLLFVTGKKPADECYHHGRYITDVLHHGRYITDVTSRTLHPGSNRGRGLALYFSERSRGEGMLVMYPDEASGVCVMEFGGRWRYADGMYL
jgi:hypothetical protein